MLFGDKWKQKSAAGRLTKKGGGSGTVGERMGLVLSISIL